MPRTPGAAATSRGALSAYEIWNEPNLGSVLRSRAATAIRRAADGGGGHNWAADPRAQVVLGGLLYHGQFGTDADYSLSVYREHPNTAAQSVAVSSLQLFH
jgi:hypothetical protein